MRIADRIAAWFGYVPRGSECVRIHCAGLHGLCVERMVPVRWSEQPPTRSEASIIVSADFKRGIPCS